MLLFSLQAVDDFSLVVGARMRLQLAERTAAEAGDEEGMEMPEDVEVRNHRVHSAVSW